MYDASKKGHHPVYTVITSKNANRFQTSAGKGDVRLSPSEAETYKSHRIAIGFQVWYNKKKGE